jgi:hypothetical protein
MKTSPGPVAATAARSPGGGTDDEPLNFRLGKDVLYTGTSFALDQCKAFFSVPENPRNLI